MLNNSTGGGISGISKIAEMVMPLYKLKGRIAPYKHRIPNIGFDVMGGGKWNSYLFGTVMENISTIIQIG
ncbi:hypothetical protein GCM10008915_58660 [Bifidobacterium pullorum subsp. gallinarum]